jgi:hypothetical protein
MLYDGEILFIVGSLIIFIPQLWKCVRTAITNEDNNTKNQYGGISILIFHDSVLIFGLEMVY